MQPTLLIWGFFVSMFMGGLQEACAKTPLYPAIFVFGDSLSDTGNAPFTASVFHQSTDPPYGETKPGQPDGRFSDGYLIIDYIAMFLGLPLLNPWLRFTADFSHGINYAVSGATALNATTLISNGVNPISFDSLEVQLSWHENFTASLTTGDSNLGKPDATAISDALYVLSIGGNDYIWSFAGNYTPADVTAKFVPMVVEKIKTVAEILYTRGARSFLFISITPLGCTPAALSLYGANFTKNSDGCLSEFNSVSYIHGLSLLNAVKSLRVAYPDAQFIFADYFGAFSHVLEHKENYGISDTLNACCGAPPGVPYRFSAGYFCSNRSSVSTSTLCRDANTYLNWDGFHFTDHFNALVANLFTTGSFLNPSDGFYN